MARLNFWLVLAGLNGAACVALGAYGAHELGTAPQVQRWFDIALHYHAWHAAAILAVALWQPAGAGCRLRQAALALFFAGTLLFSGSLYKMALTDLPLFVGAAPIGGAAFIFGWLALALAGLLSRRV